jgi:hydrogenase-4 component F
LASRWRLFGTILVYLAAQPVMGQGLPAMAWDRLLVHASKFDPALLNLAFVFLLLGYGTKAGLVPLHAWLPDAHAEGPTPISAVLSGLLLNVALYAVLRFKMLMSANPSALAPGPLMVGSGDCCRYCSPGLMLYRRGDIKRLFAYSSIEHMGIITFAFGMGGPLANFAGLLHMTMHSLTKSAIFFAVGHISQVKGTQRISTIRGLTATHPAAGLGVGGGGDRHRRNAAVRGVHERISGGQFHLCPPAVVSVTAGHWFTARLWYPAMAVARSGVRSPG